MEASNSFPEGNSQDPNVLVLIERVESQEPVYRFFVDGQLIIDVGVTREDCGRGQYTFNFFNDYKQYAAADINVKDGVPSIEWFGPDGDHSPQEYLDLLPYFVEATVYSEFGVAPVNERQD